MYTSILAWLFLVANSFASTQQTDLSILLLLDGGAETLPYQLGSLDKLTYSKERTHIWISSGGEVDSLQQWIAGTRNKYKRIDQYEESNAIKTTSPTDRLEHFLQKGCAAATKVKSRYVLAVNSNVFFHHTSLIEHLIETLTEEINTGVVSPMLETIPQSALTNFNCSTDLNCDAIRQRKKTGLFTVAEVSKIWMMDLDHSLIHKLVHHYVHNSTTKIGMLQQLVKLGMKLHLTNKEKYGFMLATENSYANQQDVINRLAFDHKIHVSEYISPLQSNLGKYIDMTYVINLKRRPQKLANMKNVIYQLGITNVNYTFAVDGEDLTQQKLDDLGYKALDGYDNPFRGGGMKTGEIGCLFSHYNIWLDAQQRNYGRILVFEDDASILHENFHDIWADIRKDINALARIEGAQTPWELLYLGRRTSRDTIDTNLGYEHLVQPGRSFWNVAYALSRRGITKLMNTEPISHAIPADDYLAVMYDRYYDQAIKEKFLNRDLAAFAVVPDLMAPRHFPGDGEYISDTEESVFMNLILHHDEF